MSYSETHTILKSGKRKRRSSFVLELSGGSTCESDNDNAVSEISVVGSPVASSSNVKLPAVPIIVNGKLVSNTVKRYQCTFDGCTKSYKKPARLEEHERTHSGERPFVCPTCQKTYFRDTHLQAHMRSHLPDSSRPFACTHDGCEKKFWTAQHLKRHEELHSGEKPFKCTESGCHQSFSKHNQLRSHFALLHCPPGTKSFRCEHQGCTKSFATLQKLRAHVKTHEERRYTCSHPACLQNRNQEFFSNWTALQAHTRTVHPPTCPYPTCNGKTFTQQKGLRAHLKIHEQREIEEALTDASIGATIHGIEADYEDEDDGDNSRPFKQRRRGGEFGRDWVCSEEGCDKDFKSRNALETHIKVTHQNRRGYVCSIEGCSASFGYKHLLQRHTARVHDTATCTTAVSTNWTDRDAPSTDAGTCKVPRSGLPSISISDPTLNANAIDIITGKAYSDRSKNLKQKALRCPYPDLACLLKSQQSEGLPTIPSLSLSPPMAALSAERQSSDPDDANATCAMPAPSCAFVFTRAYDLRRHLSAVHILEVNREEAAALVEAMRIP